MVVITSLFGNGYPDKDGTNIGKQKLRMKKFEDRLPFGILGDDSASAQEKLEKYTGEVDWNYLKPHFETGVLVYVDPSLPLTEVGHAFSTDDAERVKKWRQDGDLVAPSRPHADHWEKSRTRFLALVVSPFVLIQPT